MNKKQIIYLIINVPLTYLLFITFGWLTYYIVEGNPTFIVSFGVLLLIFSSLTIGISAGIITALKIYNTNTLAIAIFEIIAIYLIIWIYIK